MVASKPVCGEECILPAGLVPQYCPGNAGGGSGLFLDSFTNPATLGDIGFGFGMPDYASTVGAAFAGVVAETCEQIPPVD